MGKKLDNLLNVGKRVLINGLVATTGLLPIAYATGCHLDESKVGEEKKNSALYGVICSYVIDGDKSGEVGDHDKDFIDLGKKSFIPGEPLTIFTTFIGQKGTFVVSILDADQRVIIADTSEIKLRSMTASNKVYTKNLFEDAGGHSEYTVVWEMNGIPRERKKFTVSY